MPILKQLIPNQKFELIRNRIGEILADEFAAQKEMHGDINLMPLVFVERFIPFDKSEAAAAINISLSRGDYSNNDARASDGTYQFFVDVYASAKSSAGVSGDQLAAINLQRMIGMARAILENPGYRTLGYAPPFSCSSSIVSIEMEDPANDGNAVHQVHGRLTFSVRVPETTELKEALPLSQSNTGVKLFLTEKGFVYTTQAIAGSGVFTLQFTEQFS